MKILKTTAVFVAGGMPLYTYVPRKARNLEARLRATSENLCKLVTLTGMTKSGKTVLAGRIFPKETAVWVDGGTVSAEDDLWNSILVSLDGFTDVTKAQSKHTTSTFGGEFEGSAGLPLFAHAQAKISTERTQGRDGEVPPVFWTGG